MPQVIAFQITISPRDASGGYPLRVQCNGAEVRATLVLPANLFDVSASGMTPTRADEFGQALGRALFVPLVRELLLATARALAEQQAHIQIQLRIAAQDVAALPWEWLTLGTTRAWTPATRDDYTLVRVGRRSQPADPLAVAGPLRLLIVAARGEEMHADALAQALDDLAEQGQIEVDLLHNATPATFEQALRRQPPHILHCAAPIAFTNNNSPRLLLGTGIDGFELARMLADVSRLRLATFTGAQGDGSRVTVGASALAALALDEDLPAAIAFAGGLPAALAVRFAAACYAQLANGATVDYAVTVGRQALAETGRGWGMPQLWLVAGGERLFNIAGVRLRAPGARHSVAGAIERLRTIERPAPQPRRPLRTDAPRRIRAQPLESQHSYAESPRRIAREPARTSNSSPRRAQPAQTARRFPWPLVGAVLVLAALLLVGHAWSARGAASSAGWSALNPVAVFSTPLPVTPTATPSIPAPARPPDSYVTYQAVTSDTLELIADKLNSNVLAIAELNHIAPTEPLREGRPLVIPVYKASVAQTQGLLIKRGNPNARKIALTFDIEIDRQTFFDILDILRQRNLKGTFFFTGRWAEAYPDAVKEAVREGEEIGNHSVTHPYFSRIGLDGAAAEVQQDEQIIHDLTGASTRPYFRFPYGDSTAATLAIIGQQGYVAYHWSADDDAISAWLDRVAKNPDAGNGGILLMHGRPETVSNLAGWIDHIEQMGFQPTTLGDVMR